MDDQISQFVAITGSDPERAKFFVESAGGDVETALSTYYESESAPQEGGEEDDEEDAFTSAVDASANATVDYNGPRTLSGAPAPSIGESMWANQGAAAASSSSSARKAGGGSSASGGRGGIATLRGVQGSGPGADDDDDSDQDENGKKKPANFYTGGERSGLNVQNPDRRRNRDEPEVVQKILTKAAEASKRRAEDDVKKGDSARSRAFAGQGRTIESETAQPDPTPSIVASRPMTSEALRALRYDLSPGIQGNAGSNEGDEVITRHITFWQDGFSIEDGPLCRYDDPQHAETLALINTNRAPLHLLNVKFGQKVDLLVDKKTNEKYTPPPPKPMKPFGGSGNRLGAPTPTMTSNAVFSSAAATSVLPAPATNAPSSAVTFEIDNDKPTTQIQIRLGDGQKMVAKFNHNHTIADIRQYINASHPGMTVREYTLQSSFPPKPLNDETQSLGDAGLINSVVIQKFT